MSNRSRPFHSSSQASAPARRPHERERLRTIPCITVDSGATVPVERAVQPDEPIVPARCAHTLRTTHADHSIAGNPTRG